MRDYILEDCKSPKGGNMLHTIRQVIHDDAKWRDILRGLNTDLRHQIVTGRQVGDYISRRSGIDFRTVFQQYLTTITIPTLEYRIEGGTLSYHWVDAVPGFSLPIRVQLTDAGFSEIRPTQAWQTASLSLKNPDDFKVDSNYYVLTRREKTAGN